ncbi:MAG: response regulator [Candidatus Aureabacteria bacterium]|nr:response regulator [Candidatus Auribacterota bacterium]
MIQKILIIDDDTDFIDACRNMLEAKNYQVISASRYDQVFPAIEDDLPDLILLDILMDHKPAGFEIAEKLSKHPTWCSIAVVFLTGYFMRTGLKDLQNEVIKKWPNIKFVLDKPVKPDLLLETIIKISDRITE